MNARTRLQELGREVVEYDLLDINRAAFAHFIPRASVLETSNFCHRFQGIRDGSIKVGRRVYGWEGKNIISFGDASSRAVEMSLSLSLIPVAVHRFPGIRDSSIEVGRRFYGWEERDVISFGEALLDAFQGG